MVSDFKWPAGLGDRPGDRPAVRPRISWARWSSFMATTSTTSSSATPTSARRSGRWRTGRTYLRRLRADERAQSRWRRRHLCDRQYGDGYNFNVTAQLRKAFDFGLSAQVGYSYTQAKNNLRSSEIASVLWSSQPIQSNPEQPGAELLRVRPAASDRRGAPRTSSPGPPASAPRSVSSSRWPRATATPAGRQPVLVHLFRAT